MIHRTATILATPCHQPSQPLWTAVGLILMFTAAVRADVDGRLPPVNGSDAVASQGYGSPYDESGDGVKVYIEPDGAYDSGPMVGEAGFRPEESEYPFDAPRYAASPNAAPSIASQGRPGVFQGGSLSATYLAGSDLGLFDVLAQTSFGFPCPTRESPVIFSPGYGLHLVDGPSTPDVPAELHDAWLEMRFLRQLSPRWSMDVSVSPGYYSDFERSRDDAIRITGRALGLFEWTPRTKLAVGVVYLDRNDVSFLPAAGLLWQPTDHLRVDLVFPRPRIAWRTHRFDLMDPSGAEYWYYLAGEFGGGTWAVQRADASDDELTYRDYRIVFGLECRPLGLTPSRIEVAYVFGRALEYSSREEEFELDDTAMARVVWGF